MNHELAHIEQQKENAYQNSLGHSHVCEDSGLTEADCGCPTCDVRARNGALLELIHKARLGKARVMRQVPDNHPLKEEWLAELGDDIRRYTAALGEDA